MPEIKFNKSTDAENEIKLDSSFVYAMWRDASAYAGTPAEIEVGTAFVGDGAKIKITGKTEGGKSAGKLTSTISGNLFVDKLDIPDNLEPGDSIYFEVELSKNGINDKSNSIPVFPKPVVTNMKWSTDKAQSGEVVKMTADIDKVDNGTEAKIIILEHDSDGAHDKITELPAIVENKKIELEWEFEYQEDTDDILSDEELNEYGGSYNPPEYFFVIDINGFQSGLEQESKLLTFKDYLELKLLDDDKNPIPDIEYEITLPDGTKKTGNLDSNGEAKLEDIPPGNIGIVYKEIMPESETTNVDDDPQDDGSDVQADEDIEEDIEDNGDDDEIQSDEEPSEDQSEDSDSDETEPRQEPQYVGEDEFSDDSDVQSEHLPNQSSSSSTQSGTGIHNDDEELLQG